MPGSERDPRAGRVGQEAIGPSSLWPSGSEGFAKPRPRGYRMQPYATGTNREGEMKTRLVLIGAALLAPFAAPVSAAPFSAIYAFGDSLSDAGNAYIATGGKNPPAPPHSPVHGFVVSRHRPGWVHNLAGEIAGRAPPARPRRRGPCARRGA